MRCPPALLAATFLLRVAIFDRKFICLIEDTKPSWKIWSRREDTGQFFRWRRVEKLAPKALLNKAIAERAVP